MERIKFYHGSLPLAVIYVMYRLFLNSKLKFKMPKMLTLKLPSLFNVIIMRLINIPIKMVKSKEEKEG